MLELMSHQIEVLKESKDLNKVAYYYDMGLGWLTQNIYWSWESYKLTQKYPGDLSEVQSWGLGKSFLL